MTLVAFVALQIVTLALLADFLGGLFHWAEDTWGSPATPIWGPLFVAPNIGHHDRPTDILSVSPWRGVGLIFLAGTLVLLVAWTLGGVSWQLWFFLCLASLNDLAHRWSHTPTVRLPWAVRKAQRFGLLQDSRHHWRHHRPPHMTNYCVLTPWLNPVLDRTRFWRALEAMLKPLLGTPRARDLA